MTEHKATPEQWAQVEEFPEPEYNACLLDLRARVEALEAAQPNYPAKPDSSPASASSLVDRLASVGVSRFYVKAAIREVAAWLTENYASDAYVVGPPPHQMLRNEANR